MSRSVSGSRRGRPAKSSTSSNSSSPPLRRRPLFESLENRLLLSADPLAALAADGVLAVLGTDGADQAIIQHVGTSADGGEIVDLNFTGMTQRFGDQTAGVRSVQADLGAGDDLIQLVDLYSTANIIGGNGDDSFVGPRGNQTWNITGQNSGTVGNVNF